MNEQHFTFQDDSELWLHDVIENHYEEALSRVDLLLSQTVEDENGCWVASTLKRPKTRFRGRQVAAARFVYCVVNRAMVSGATVVRHRCHNERCCNPTYLVPGTAADNKRYCVVNRANGVDYRLL